MASVPAVPSGIEKCFKFSIPIFHIPLKRSHRSHPEYHIFIEVWPKNKKNIRTSMVRVLIAVKILYDVNRLSNSAQWQIFLIHILAAKSITSFHNEWKLYFIFSFGKHDFSRGTLIFFQGTFSVCSCSWGTLLTFFLDKNRSIRKRR